MKRMLWLWLILAVVLGNACCVDSQQKPAQSESIPRTSEPAAPTAAPAAAAASTAKPTSEPIVLAGQAYRGDETALSLVLTAEEMPLLDRFSRLETLDLSGSACYAQILAYAQAHPQVRVVYTVDVEGQAVPSDAEELTRSALTDPGLLTYLPRLKSVTMSAPLPLAEAEALHAAAPQASLGGELTFAGLTVPLDAEALDLSAIAPEDVDDCRRAVALLPQLKQVELDPAEGESPWTLEEAGSLVVQYPDLLVQYTATVFGVTFSLTDEVVSFNRIDLKDQEAELRRILPYMAHVGRLDMEYCNIPDERMAELRSDFPAPKIVWRVFLKGRYHCRTDAIMIRFSNDSDGERLYDKDTHPLIYCNELKYVDLGHDKITDAYFTAYMPELEVLILAVGEITDISALKNCPKLEYLEIFTGHLTDISVLAELKNLKHLNMANNKISDITPLFELNLERLFLSRNPIPKEQIEAFRKRFPNCDVDSVLSNPTGGTWRKPGGRYTLLRKQLSYDNVSINTYSAFNQPWTPETP